MLAAKMGRTEDQIYRKFSMERQKYSKIYNEPLQTIPVDKLEVLKENFLEDQYPSEAVYKKLAIDWLEFEKFMVNCDFCHIVNGVC